MTFLLLLGSFMKLIIKMQGLGSLCDAMLEFFSSKPDSFSHNNFYTLNSFAWKELYCPSVWFWFFNPPCYQFALLQRTEFISIKSNLNFISKYILVFIAGCSFLKHASSGRYDPGCKHIALFAKNKLFSCVALLMVPSLKYWEITVQKWTEVTGRMSRKQKQRSEEWSVMSRLSYPVLQAS